MAAPKFGRDTLNLFACLKNAQGVPEAVPIVLFEGEDSVVWSREYECFSYDCVVNDCVLRILEGAIGDETVVTQLASRLRDPQASAELRLAKAGLRYIPILDAHPPREVLPAGFTPADQVQMVTSGAARGQLSAEAELPGLMQV